VWAAPGDTGYVHRVGGIEKDVQSGNISYDAANHQNMTDLRAKKLAQLADFIPDQGLEQGVMGGLAVVAWGSTYGTIYQAVKEALAEGYSVAHIHLRHINPLPGNLGELLTEFEAVLVPELNTGQLATVLRDRLLVDAIQLNQVNGQPFAVADVKAAIAAHAPRRMQEVSRG
jgi:2-oxoglutarate ferredoxin oxidoreductase subunit alpha